MESGTPSAMILRLFEKNKNEAEEVCEAAGEKERNLSRAWKRPADRLTEGLAGAPAPKQPV